MSEDQDRVWLTALAGQATSDSIDAREARELRRGILTRVAEPDGPCATEDPAREAELIARARRAGLISADRDAAGVRRRSVLQVRWIGWRGAAAAAALVGVVGIGLWMRPAGEPETVRGNPDGVVRLQAQDAPVLRRRLVEQLRAAGVQATSYETFGRLGIDADLPQPVPEEIRRILAEAGIPLPQDGVLRVEIQSVEER